MDFDELLKHFLGNFGRYQRFVVLLLWLVGSSVTLHNLSIVFMAAAPDHRCAVPELDALTNLSQETRLKYTIPKEVLEGEERYSKCLMYNRNYTNITELEIIKELEIENQISNRTDGNVTVAKSEKKENSSETVETVHCTNGWVYDNYWYDQTIISEVNTTFL